MKPSIVSRDEWLEARLALLEQEKEATRRLDEVNRARQTMPWVQVGKPYEFETVRGRSDLAGLFGGRSQLIVYHFMFAPDWGAGCVGCSFLADHIDGANIHLQHHDVTLVVVSRAPLSKLQAYRARMGWKFEWVSSHGSDFNRDFGVSFTEEELAAGPVEYNFAPTTEAGEEMPGLSVFAKGEDGAVYHTYSSYARGDERSLGAYMFLDATPNGRNEHGPHYNLMDWVKRHDEYAGAGSAGCCG